MILFKDRYVRWERNHSTLGLKAQATPLSIPSLPPMNLKNPGSVSITKAES
ncbi:hypothetical protein ACRRTK_011225 [Alexandromys fortis]